MNYPGTIDSDYGGGIGIILVNLSRSDIVIEGGEGVCKKVFAKYETVEFMNVEIVSETKRGKGLGTTEQDSV